MYSLGFILPFALELSLKSLLIKSGGEPEREHNLADIYEKLPSEARVTLQAEYRRLAADSCPSFSELPDLLKKHGRSFVAWRYLDEEAPEQEGKALQFAICAVLNVMND